MNRPFPKTESDPLSLATRREFLTRTALGLGALGLTPLAIAVADDALPSLTCIPLAGVKMSGPLGQRHAANIPYLLWRYRDLDRLLFPFEHRDQWQRARDWDGEYIGKWLEAAVLTAEATRDAALLAAVDEAAKRLRATQEPDGYLGTELPDNRLKPAWPLWMHWLAMKALREHGQRRGDRASLDAAIRAADWLVREFHPITDAKSPYLGGNGQLSSLDELAEMHAITGDRKYLDFALTALAHYPPILQMRKDGLVSPLHAYSLMTCLSGAVRIYQALGARDELRFLEKVWDDIVANHLFPTASVSTEELFKAPPRDVPNGKLQETCATVEWLNFTHRLYLATGEIRYAHMIERTVRNALLGAQSTDGLKWNYFTPLHSIKAWFGGPTDCCYFSGPRGIARLPELLCHLDADGVRVDLFEPGEVRFSFKGAPVTLVQETRYPAEGAVRVRVSVEKPLAFALKLRVPEHVANVSLRINDAAPPPAEAGRHAVVSREWQTGDTVDLTFEPQAWLAELSDGTAAIVRGAEVLAFDVRDNHVDPGTVRLAGAPELKPAPPSEDRDHRPRYRCQLEIAGKPAEALLTPFAVAGNATPGYTEGYASFRAAFARSPQASQPSR